MRTLEPIAKLDLAFSIFCLHHKFNQPVARFSKAISHTGDGHLYLIFGLLAWTTDGSNGMNFLTTGLIAFAIELPVYWALKNSVQRRRPEEFSPLLTAFITPSDRYSLPSGHTAAAFLMAILIGHFYPSLFLGALLWAGVIGSARILLGVHFLTDVIIGAMLGTSCAMLSLSLMEGWM
ncbi:phosphatase PAP2 family protein [Vibrio sp. V27_P1S3P104]|uniref:phosphatase PAP2 family protein n=1 Tax=unclassified Vibrio TaxID=2614977 RepID=UPI001372970A|nr:MULTISPECIES: phosphatase PAP2 family protein [unclassified Vibrio]NAW69075.1 phosphatase PAP2 family protein [Vibrio sp. V28_P6S34P95]NAX04331.1 phosphatase PAP2 family protein [Vibrio sp. V30_P3S12P165]NAX35751.1 phosphatase PAP2 family protein [Vibrio sp. V29_P1S30P107]NAX36160.1 phosphatase PAP2 family protein [Vibrio sp. V27_P1S3P104]NAX39819.1 phosphatase PAP2 family protein [Vibrio sp. V26_P1S5P106]